MGRRSIQATLGALSGAGLLTALLLAAGLVAFTTSMHHAVTVQGSAAESVRAAQQIQVQLLDAQRFAVAGEPDPSSAGSVEERLRHWLEVTERRATSAEQRVRVAELRAWVEEVEERWGEARAEGSPEGAVVTPEEVAATQQAVSGAVDAADRLIDLHRIEAVRVRHAARNLDDTSDTVGVGLAGLLAALLFTAGWSLRRLLVRPLEEVRAAIVRFGAGDLRSRAPTGGPVEIAEIAATFNATADALDRQRRNQLAFVASVAHDLKNPLHALKLAAVVGERGRSEDRAHANALVLRQVDQLVRMVDDLLDASRIEAGQLELRTADVDVAQLGRDVLDLLGSGADRHELVLSCDGAVTAHADPIRVSQVLTNLVSNAIKYSPEGGRITVRIEGDALEVRVAVTDEGIGIPLEEQATLFQPFRRAQGGRSVARGSGLGLSVARRIVDAHGGTLAVESRPGVGSTFLVRLPKQVSSMDSMPGLLLPRSLEEPIEEPTEAPPRG